MAKKIKFGINNTVEPFTLILSTREHTHLGKIHNADVSNLICKMNFNSVNEISFTVYYEVNGYIDPLWNKIENFMLVYIKDLNEYYQIVIDKDHSDDLHKEVQGFSLCEAELGQTMIYGLEINNANDPKIMDDKILPRDEITMDKATIFYDFEYPQFSLLHRVLEKVPHYHLKHVDGSLAHEQRMFSVNGKSVYDFLTKDCAEQFNCIFQFDSTDRSISVYDLYTVCMNDDCSYYQTEGRRYRGPFNDVCPKCGSKHIYFYGNDTHIFVDKDNLTKEVKFTTDTDSIKNTLRLEAGDDNVTYAVQNSNPNGSRYITYFSPEMKALMPDDLVTKLEDYDTLYNSKKPEYEQITEDLYEAIDEEYYLEHSMMPKRVVSETNAQIEANKLNANTLSPVSISKLSQSTTKSSVDNAVLGMAKVIIRGGYYKVEISESTYTFNGITGTWRGKFTVTSYADSKDEVTAEGIVHKKDSATTGYIQVVINDDYEKYLEQKIYKQIAQDETRSSDKRIYEVVTMPANNSAQIQEFRNVLRGNELPKDDPAYIPGYNLTSLKSFDDAVQSCIEIMVSLGHGEPDKNEKDQSKDFYYKIYMPLYSKKQVLKEEIARRDNQIAVVQAQRETLENQRIAIQEQLNFKDFLDDELYLSYCAYRREDTYSNSNFHSEGLTTPEIFKKVQNYLEEADKQMIKAGTPQHTLSANLYNLLLMKEFAVLTDEFELGNWIRARIDNQIYRLRLIGYEINFNDLSTLNTTFSNLTITADGYNDIMSVLGQAKNMATSYTSVQKQANKGNEAERTLDNFRQIGLDSALYKIKNNNTEEIVIDNHGLNAANYDDISDSYGDEQVRITHNLIAFTKDNWKTVSAGLGKMKYRINGEDHEDFGLNADHMVSGIIIGADIYSGNYDKNNNITGTHLSLMDGSFDFAGEKLTYDSKNDILKIGKDDNSITYYGSTGKLVLGSAVEISYDDLDGVPTKVSDLENDLGFTDQKMVTRITKNTITTEYLNAKNIKAGSVDAENITGTTITGKDIVGGTLRTKDGIFIDDDSIIFSKLTNDISLKLQGDEYSEYVGPTKILGTNNYHFTKSGKTINCIGYELFDGFIRLDYSGTYNSKYNREYQNNLTINPEGIVNIGYDYKRYDETPTPKSWIAGSTYDADSHYCNIGIPLNTKSIRIHDIDDKTKYALEVLNGVSWFNGQIRADDGIVINKGGLIVNNAQGQQCFKASSETGDIWIKNKAYLYTDNPNELYYTLGTRNIRDITYNPSVTAGTPLGYLHINVDNSYYGVPIGFASDKRLKTDIKMSKENALDIIASIKHRSFKWRESGLKVETGYIAQELQQIKEDFVYKVGNDEKSYYQISEQNLLPYMTKAIQELSEKINSLENKIKELKGEKENG